MKGNARVRKMLKFSLTSIGLILSLLLYIEMPSCAGACRFVDNGDGTVTDTELKVMWQKGDNGNEVTFELAQEYCRDLRLGGHSDWRLPKPGERDTAVAVELMMPLHSRDALARFDLYWSNDSTTLIPFNYRPARGAEVAAVYPSMRGDRAFVRAIRSCGTAKGGGN
jgi:hypothetical protein